MKIKTISQWVASICLAAITISTANAAAYIKFDGIDGEAMAPGHERWVEIMSFSQAIHKPSTEGSATSGRRRRAAAVFEDIVVVKELDKSTPKLAESVARGAVIPRVTIDTTVRTSDAEFTYLRYELKNVLVTSYQVTLDNPDLLPVDQFSLNFEEIKVTYVELGGKENDKETGQVEYSWKVEEGEK